MRFQYLNMSDLTDLYEFFDLSGRERRELLEWCEENIVVGTFREFKAAREGVAIRTPSEVESSLVMLRWG